MKILIYYTLFLSSMAFAEDWTTSDGKTYSDVTVIKSDSKSVTILDKDGGARIPLAKLPPDLQKRFNYTPPVQNASAATTNDTVPLKERPEWSQRLIQLATVLQEKQKEGGSFTSKGSVYNWKDITGIEPNALSYMIETGTGKIPYNDLPPELATQLTLNEAEASKWESDEMQRQQSIHQIAINKQKAEQAKADAEHQRMLAQKAYLDGLYAQAMAEAKERDKEADAEKAKSQAAQASQAAGQAQQTAEAQKAAAQAQQVNAATIRSLQIQIVALNKQLDAVQASQSKAGLYDGQMDAITRQISALQSQINALQYAH